MAVEIEHSAGMASDDYEEYGDPERSDWGWSDELEYHVSRLVCGEMTLEAFKAWYKSKTEPQEDTEARKAAEKMYLEWQADSFWTDMVRVFKEYAAAPAFVPKMSVGEAKD